MQLYDYSQGKHCRDCGTAITNSAQRCSLCSKNETWRRAVGLGNRGKKLTDEQRAGISKRMTGIVHSTEVRRKMSQSHLGKP